ncbi:unnamed protein product [Adineta ricciae]|uniref:RING-type domain-containing protein n=1 Tax=Adineta ricciae TaxID=249248 RepID=A0A816BUD8_ADIRI|nr:unnamed protein product [Adineta ricciae]
MTSTQQKGISTERVCNPTAVNFIDLECAICHDILWKPVACQSCETPFCSPCIQQWLKGTSKCPSGCKVYSERKCPPFIARLLARLQISCFYKPNGCTQLCYYEALDKHELELVTHKRTCAAVRVSCKDCKAIYKRGDFAKKHSSSTCLKQQMRQLREQTTENKHTIQILTTQLHDLLTWKGRLSQDKPIIFDDLTEDAQETHWIPAHYKALKWSKVVYMSRPYAAATYPTSGYMAAFIASGNQNLAFFNEEATISGEKATPSFGLDSLSVCSAWNENLKLILTGYRKSVEVSTFTTLLQFGKPQNISLKWPNIDKLVLQPVGESALIENQETPSDTHCIITQLKIQEASSH